MSTLKQHYFAKALQWLCIAGVISFVDGVITHQLFGIVTTIICFLVWLRFAEYVILFKFKS